MTRIFISHSHSDDAIAYELVDFLLEALGLNSREILCTSNPDQGLSYSSSSITDQLKEALKNSEALIILITSDSLHSAWIPFEAGSFWTTDKPIIPILGPGLTQNDLPGPLKNFLSISIGVQDVEDKVNSATNQLAKILNLQQAFTKRRSIKLQEFLDALKAWQSKRPAVPDLQQENEQLKAQIQELERSHSQELEKKESIIAQLKEHIEQLKSSQKTTVIVEVELKSEKGIDYTKLRDLLAAGNWKEADQETAKVMLEAAGKKRTEYLSEEDLDNFPCEDLRTINQLWLHYSDGKFGFSVQKEIYESLGYWAERREEYIKAGAEENYNLLSRLSLGDRVGWRKDENWVTYSDLYDMTLFDSKQGYLPTPPNYIKISMELERAKFSYPAYEIERLTDTLFVNSSLARRLVTCKI